MQPNFTNAGSKAGTVQRVSKPAPSMLTVIIRDDSPMIHSGDSPSYRSVRIQLTPEQQAKVELRHDYEAISRCIVEPGE